MTKSSYRIISSREQHGEGRVHLSVHDDGWIARMRICKETFSRGGGGSHWTSSGTHTSLTTYLLVSNKQAREILTNTFCTLRSSSSMIVLFLYIRRRFFWGL